MKHNLLFVLARMTATLILSLMYAFNHPLTYTEAPELMCLDLYRDFDFNTLSAIASPVKVNLSATEGKRIFWDD